MRQKNSILKRGYFLSLLGLGLSSVFFSFETRAAQPSLTPPSNPEAFEKSSVEGLNAAFWKRFDLFRVKEATWKKERANDFAAKVGFALPSLDFSGDYPLLVFQVRPLLHKGIGQQVVLFLNRGDFHSTGNVPIRVWFDNGESIGFSRVKWANRPVFALLSDKRESDKIARIIQSGAVPVLVSQGRVGLRLRYKETAQGNQALAWYQKASNPLKNTSLQKHLLSKTEEFEKKHLKAAQKKSN